MVYVFTSTYENVPYTIYMGKDKYENEDLIKNGFINDIWFHVDDLSSAHIYLRLPYDSSFTIDNIPKTLLNDCCQLTKYNSISGNKIDNVRIVYTMWNNLKKTGDMEVGQVSFHSEHKRKFNIVSTRDNTIINRLNKTKQEITMKDFIEIKNKLESEQRSKINAEKRKQAENEKKLKQQYQQDKQSRDYALLFDNNNMTSNAELSYNNNAEDDFM